MAIVYEGPKELIYQTFNKLDLPKSIIGTILKKHRFHPY